MGPYLVMLTVIALVLFVGGASVPLTIGAAGLGWVKGARTEARLAVVASACLVGTSTTYLLLVILRLPPSVLWLIPVAALAGNGVAAVAGGRLLRGSGRMGLAVYAVGVIAGLGPPLMALDLASREIAEVSLPGQVWGLLGVLWTLIAGVVGLWIGVLSLPSPGVDWDDA